MQSTETHAPSALPTVEFLHLAAIIGHQRHISSLAHGLPKALGGKVVIFDPKKAENRTDLEVISHMAFQSQDQGYKVFALPLSSVEANHFDSIIRIFKGNFSIFNVQTDADEFARRHHMGRGERNAFEAEVKAFEDRYHALIESIRIAHEPKYCLIRGSRREAAQIDHMAQRIERTLGRVARALS